MRNALTLVTLCIAVCFLSFPGRTSSRTVAARAAAPAAVQALALTSPCPDGIEDIDHCTMQGGCGELGDALLNRAKNRTDLPAAGETVSNVTLDQMKGSSSPRRGTPGGAGPYCNRTARAARETHRLPPGG